MKDQIKLEESKSFSNMHRMYQIYTVNVIATTKINEWIHTYVNRYIDIISNKVIKEIKLNSKTFLKYSKWR